MKKKFTFLMTAMALILAIMGPRSVAWGQAKESYTATITSKTWSDNGTQTLNNVNWTLTNDGNYYGYDATKGQQVGSGSNPAKSMSLSTNGISGTITSITINTSGASSVNATISASVGGTQWGNAKSITANATDYTFTGSGTGEIVFSWTQTSSKALYFKSITVVYQSAPAATLESIVVSGTAADLWTADEFSHEGITVMANWSEGNPTDVTSACEYSGYNMTSAGEQTVTVSYTAGEVTKSDTYTVTVNTIGNTQDEPYTVAQAKALIDAGDGLNEEVYVEGIICQVDSYNSTYHSITYWISTDGTQDNMFEVYSGKNLNNTNFTSISDIVLQADVIVYGKIKKFSSTYEFDKNNYLVSYTAPQSYSITLNYSTGGTISADKQTAAEGETVTITIEPASGYTLATLTGATFNETVDPELLTYTFTMPAEEVTISATFNAVPTYTISFTTNGVAETAATIVINQGAEIGSTLPQPTATNIPNGYTFRGWSENEVDLTDVEPTYVTAETVPRDDMILYAVFAIAEVSGATALNKMGAGDVLNNGDNIVIVATGNDWAKALYQETVSSSYVNFYDFTGNVNDVITDSKNYVTLNIATEGKWKLGDATNGYVYNASSNDLTVDTKNSTEWTISWVNDKNKYSIKNGNRWLSCRSDLTTGGNQYKFRGGGTTTTNGTVYFDLYKLTTSTTTYSNFCTTVKALSGPITQSDITANTAYYIYAVTTINWPVEIAALGNTNPANLIIEDGGQLICNNAVKATVQKTIAGHSGEDATGGWNFIASPITETLDPISDMVGMIPEELEGFDLYLFDQTQDYEWQNYYKHDFDIANGQGYLYANAATTTLEFAGTLYNGNGEFPLTYSQDVNFAGWNLMGNPFPCNVTLTGSYYVMNAYRDEVVSATDPTIAPCEGYFAIANAPQQTVAMTKGTATSSRSTLTASISKADVRGNAQVDRAIVSFDEINALPKFNLNADNSKLYIPQDGKNYAVVFAANEGTLPLNFEVKENGTYTITVNTENIDAEYIHLIDNMTGMDVDLLTTDSYTFEAKDTDYTSRFKLVFDVKNEASAGSDSNFAYMSDGNLVISDIEGQATLQIVDMMGRVLSTETVSGNYNKALNLRAGVYVLNLNGMTQKIVVE